VRADARLSAAKLANWSSLVLDFVARQKIGGTHLTYSYLKQFPILPPSAYTEDDLAYIVPRVLELTYTSHDLAPWAADLGYAGAPFGFDPARRSILRAELDATYARLYGLTRDELRYILDPSDTHGADYPSETFRGLKNNDTKAHGEYRTRRLVLEAWDAQAKQSAAVAEVKATIPAIVPPRVPFAANDITTYLQFLIYAWAQKAEDRAELRKIVRAFSLLQNPQSISVSLQAEDSLLPSWRESFLEPIKGLTLRPILEALVDRKAIHIVSQSAGEFFITLSEDARMVKIPSTILQDADFSLRAARKELAKNPPLTDPETAEFEYLSSLATTA